MSTRKSTVFLSYLAVTMVVFILVFVHAVLKRRSDSPLLREQIAMVERYGLADLCIFGDARYTRNPTAADLSTPFQDHPLSLEHFPSGSIIAPPALVRREPGSKGGEVSWAQAQGPRRRTSEGELNDRRHALMSRSVKVVTGEP